ncbi:MAG TPA: FHA domain-containing protein [Pyrinomonadaceae bacterium]|nr:FHA domain-containing protein [Pyrinomonadaceae bacterium]
MQNAPQSAKKSVSADWLVRGVLTKIGDIVDRMTGRRYKPSSSLATSELIERMKFLMDSEALTEDGRTFVPHNIKLKMQWDKFSTDSEESLRALEYEFLTAAVDHVNDKRYYTKAPFHVEAKPDYFTSGVKLFVSFDKFVDDEREAGITVAVPGETPHPIAEAPVAEPVVRPIVVRYSFGGNPFQKELRVKEGKRLSVGRTKENDLSIDDPSISKYHASLMLDAQGILHVADTGSTNGTFVNGERIAYGKAVAVSERDKVRFGLVEAQFQSPRKAVVTEVLPEAVPEVVADIPKTESYSVGEFQFTKRMETIAPATTIAATIAKVADDVAPRPKVPEMPPTNNSESIAPQPQITSDSIAAKLNDEDDIEIP